MAQFVGKRIIPRHEGVWSVKKAYEPLVIVLDEQTGDSYMSRRDVPAGTALDNASYWAKSGVFNAQLKETYDRMTGDMTDTLHQMNEDFAQKHREIDADLAAEKKHVDDTVSDMRQELTQTEAQLTEQTQTAVNLTTHNRTEIESRMAVIEKRQDANVTASTDKNADYAAEVADARVDWLGQNRGSLNSRMTRQEACMVFRIFTGLFIAANNGSVVVSHASYKGHSTEKIPYEKKYGSLYVEREHLVLDNGYVAAVAFYDKDGEFLKAFYKTEDFSMTGDFAWLSDSLIPDESKFFAVSLKDAAQSVAVRFLNAGKSEVLADIEWRSLNKAVEREYEQAQKNSMQRGETPAGINLYNPADTNAVNGFFLDSVGRLRESDKYRVSGYIPVVPGETYYATKGTGGAKCCIFDGMLNVLGAFEGKTETKIPEDGRYVRISVSVPDAEAMLVRSKYKDYPYEEFCANDGLMEKVRETTNRLDQEIDGKLGKVKSKNLFDKDSPNIIMGQYLLQSGKLGTNPSYFVSDFIPVTAAETYYSHMFGTGGAFHCAYAKDRQTVLASYKDGVLEMPEEAMYLRLSGVIKRMDEQQLEQGDSFSGYEAYSDYMPIVELERSLLRVMDDVEELKQIGESVPIQHGKNFLDPNAPGALMGKYLMQNGTVADALHYWVSDFIPVEAGQTYSSLNLGLGGAYNCVYEADKETVLRAFKEEPLTIPEGGAYVRLSCNLNNLGQQQFEKGEQPTEYEEYTDYLPSLRNKQRLENLSFLVEQTQGAALEAVLPETLYFCKGVPLSVYYENILFKSLNDAASVFCDKAKPFSRLMNFDFSEEGMGTCSLHIRKGLRDVNRQEFSYVVTDAEKNRGKTAKLLFIGDSFTDSGRYLMETQRLLTESGVSVELIGTCGNSKFKAEGLSGGSLSNTFLTTSAGVGRVVKVKGVKQAPNTGYPGRVYQDDTGKQWTTRGSVLDEHGNGMLVVTKFQAKDEDFADFPEEGTLTKVSTGGEGDAVIQYSSPIPCYHNPFIHYDTMELNIRYYLDFWGFPDPDVVVFQFTWNDLGLWKDDLSQMKQNFVTAVDHVHDKLPKAKVVISVEPFGSIYSGRDWEGKKYTVLNFVRALKDAFETEAYRDYCVIAPAYACVDLVHGYSTATECPNSRYPDIKETKAGDGVHPGTGMLQIADCLYPIISKLLS